MYRSYRQSLAVEPGAVQVQARTAEPLSDCQGLLRRTNELLGAVLVSEATMHVARHRRERSPRTHEGVYVLLRPIPDLDLEPELVDPPHPLLDRQVEEDHLSADGQRERRLRQWRTVLRAAHCFSISSSRTGRPICTDS